MNGFCCCCYFQFSFLNIRTVSCEHCNGPGESLVFSINTTCAHTSFIPFTGYRFEMCNISETQNHFINKFVSVTIFMCAVHPGGALVPLKWALCIFHFSQFWFFFCRKQNRLPIAHCVININCYTNYVSIFQCFQFTKVFDLEFDMKKKETGKKLNLTTSDTYAMVEWQARQMCNS